MKTQRNVNYRSLDYGAKALIVLVLSIGFAAIVYGVQMIPFDLFNLPAWVFGPLGVYTLIYSFVAGKDAIYYLVWGSVMFIVAATSAFYKMVNVIIVFGVLLIVLAVIGLIAYRRSR